MLRPPRFPPRRPTVTLPALLGVARRSSLVAGESGATQTPEEADTVWAPGEHPEASFSGEAAAVSSTGAGSAAPAPDAGAVPAGGAVSAAPDDPETDPVPSSGVAASAPDDVWAGPLPGTGAATSVEPPATGETEEAPAPACAGAAEPDPAGAGRLPPPARAQRQRRSQGRQGRVQLLVCGRRYLRSASRHSGRQDHLRRCHECRSVNEF